MGLSDDIKAWRAARRNAAGGMLARPTQKFRNKAKYTRKTKHAHKEEA